MASAEVINNSTMEEPNNNTDCEMAEEEIPEEPEEAMEIDKVSVFYYGSLFVFYFSSSCVLFVLFLKF